MLLENLKPTLLIEAAELFEREEIAGAQQIQQAASKLPAFPGTELKRQIEDLIGSSAQLLKDFARKAKPWAADRGYKTEIFDLMLDNPEKVAKHLIKKYTSSYKADGMAFNIRDILKDISLDLSK